MLILYIRIRNMRYAVSASTLTTKNRLNWQTLNSRQSNFNIIKSINYKVGNNILANRLSILNNKIALSDLNLSLDSFKCKYKLSLLAN